MNSCENQKISKLDYSGSSSQSEEDVRGMVEQVFSTLVKGRVLPKGLKVPEGTIMNLSYLVNTLCDDYLLEIELPTKKQLIVEPCIQEDMSLDENGASDVLKKICYESKSLEVCTESCKALRNLLTRLVRNEETDELEKNIIRLEEKVEFYNCNIGELYRTLREKEKEIAVLKKQIKRQI